MNQAEIFENDDIMFKMLNIVNTVHRGLISFYESPGHPGLMKPIRI